MKIDLTEKAIHSAVYWQNRCCDLEEIIEQFCMDADATALVQEPVACVIDGDLYFHHEIDWEDLAYQGHGVELLYTTPPNVATPLAAPAPEERSSAWVGLTDEEIDVIDQGMCGEREFAILFALTIEAGLKAKNSI